MAFTPITSSQDITYARTHSSFRNANREAYWGVPVFFTPSNWSYNTSGGYGGPKYGDSGGYSYDKSPWTNLGNCTWWCAGRSEEANGIALGNLGYAKNWYTNYTGNKSTNISNLSAGDIIVFSGGDGHVMFVEQISGSTVTISQSAWSTRSVWSGKSCLVTTYNLSDLTVGSSVDMYKDLASSYYVTVVGYLHTGGGSPTTTYSLTYRVSPDGSGTITGSPQGSYEAGTSITLTATANAGYTFDHWLRTGGGTITDATFTRNMTYDRDYTAYFTSDDDSTEIIACTMAIKKKKGQINEITILV